MLKKMKKIQSKIKSFKQIILYLILDYKFLKKEQKEINLSKLVTCILLCKK